MLQTPWHGWCRGKASVTEAVSEGEGVKANRMWLSHAQQGATLVFTIVKKKVADQNALEHTTGMQSDPWPHRPTKLPLRNCPLTISVSRRGASGHCPRIRFWEVGCVLGLESRL